MEKVWEKQEDYIIVCVTEVLLLLAILDQLTI